MNKCTISYANKYEGIVITNAELFLIKTLYELDRKDIAVQFLHMQYSLGLKVAHDICNGISTSKSF